MTTPPMTDPTSRALRAWRVTPPTNPRFRAETWLRIAATRQSAAGSWFADLRLHATSWAVAFACAVGAAGFAGHLAGRERNAAEREVVLRAYVTAIDARAMADTMDRTAGR